MIPPPPTVVITRATVPKAFAEPLEAARVAVVGIPGCTQTLLDSPTEPPLSPLNASGWVITSQWGWQGLQQWLQAHNVSANHWPPLAVVGNHTAQRIQAAGGQVHLIADTSAQMAKALRKTGIPGDYLWPCGNQPLQAWVNHLPKTLRIQSWLVYDTHPRAFLTTRELDTLANANILAVTSPSHLHGLLAHTKQLPNHLIAIGPTTAQAIANATGHVPAAVAETSSLEAMARACLATLNQI